jgi:lipopolysaccharide transport system permease protein
VNEQTADAVPAAPADELPITIIERRHGWRLVDLRELWRYRELFLVLAWRDVSVRYKQTVLGILWAIIQPFAIMVVLSLFFSRLAELSSGSIPYPLFVYAGLLPWTFFAAAVAHAGQSVVGNQDLITKVYFPRLLLPVSAAAGALVDFACAFVMLLALMLALGYPPRAELFLYVPLMTFALALTAIGVGTWMAALTTAYRDFRHALPFLIQLWMFATPSIYMREHADLNPRWGMVLPLNPVDGLIANFRAACLGWSFDYYALFLSGTISVLLFLSGCLYFRRVERSFADVI